MTLLQLKISIVSNFIWKCLRKGVNPWNYFQLNAQYFNEDKGIYSKIELNKHIPVKWSLDTWELPFTQDPQKWEQHLLENFKFPYFLKPEWGQSSHGVFRILNHEELSKALKTIKANKIPYYYQEAAHSSKEVDIFYVRSSRNPKKFSALSVTEIQNLNEEVLPIQSIFNDTKYSDLSSKLTSIQKQKISNICESIGNFQIARIGTKCESLEDLVAGEFQIFEINVFLPLPISLFDDEMNSEEKKLFINDLAEGLAEISKHTPKKASKRIFWKKLSKLHKIKKSLSFMEMNDK